jgi:hypothetical protein
MYAPNGPHGSSPRFFLASFLIRPREYGSAGVWMNVRLACAIFDLCLGVVMFSFGRWEAVFPLAASVVLWTRCVLQRRALQHRAQS